MLSQSDKDVTNDLRFWGEYAPGKEFILLEDVYFHTRNNNLVPEKYYNAYSPADLVFKWPKSFDDYKKSSEQFPEFKILLKGTRIKSLKITYVDNTTWSYLNVIGVILNGDYMNVEINLKYVSICSNPSPIKGICSLRPDPKYIAPVVQR